MDIEQLQDSAEMAETMLKSIANRHRLMILCALQERAHDVSSLVEIVGLSQSAISQHLKILRESNVVVGDKQGVNVFYRISDPVVSAILATLYLAYCHPNH
jgi:DNA-binding transcriptional ArsR family regulator